MLRTRILAGRGRRRVAGSALLPVVLLAGACKYDPAQFADTPALSECVGVPATIGVGWAEAEGPDGDGDGYPGKTYYGTEGDDVVVITNGPVRFYGLGGNDLICLNDTGMAWGPGEPGFEGSVTVLGGEGDDTVYVLTEAPEGEAPPAFFLSSGANSFHGGPGSDFVLIEGDDHVDTGGGFDAVWDLGGSGETHLGAGDDYFFEQDTEPDVAWGDEGYDYYDCGWDLDVRYSFEEPGPRGCGWY